MIDPAAVPISSPVPVKRMRSKQRSRCIWLYVAGTICPRRGLQKRQQQHQNQHQNQQHPLVRLSNFLVAIVVGFYKVPRKTEDTKTLEQLLSKKISQFLSRTLSLSYTYIWMYGRESRGRENIVNIPGPWHSFTLFSIVSVCPLSFFFSPQLKI